MKRTKRILAMALVVVMLMSVMGVAVSAASMSFTSTKYGYLVPTDSKQTKTVSTVKLYGAYDYIDFYMDANYDDVYYFFAIFSNKNYTDDSLIDEGYFYCAKAGEYVGSALITLKGKYKTGTYYGFSVAVKMDSNGNMTMSESSMKEFKVVVNRTTNFKKYFSELF